MAEKGVHSTVPSAHLVRCPLSTVQSQTDATNYPTCTAYIAQSEGPSIFGFQRQRDGVKQLSTVP